MKRKKKEVNEWENVPEMEQISEEVASGFKAFMEADELNTSTIPVNEDVQIKRTKTRSKHFFDDEILFVYANGDIHLKDGVKRKEYVNELNSYDDVDEADAYVPIDLIDNRFIDYDVTN